MHPEHPPFEPIRLSRWVTFLSTIASILFFLVLICAAFVLSSGSIFGAIAVLVGGLITVACLFVFCMIAEEVHDIKNRLDEYIHNHP